MVLHSVVPQSGHRLRAVPCFGTCTRSCKCGALDRVRALGSGVRCRLRSVSEQRDPQMSGSSGRWLLAVRRTALFDQSCEPGSRCRWLLW